MKRILAVLLILACLCGNALATDLSGMSYKELVELKDKINLAMWQSQEWQEVTVPKGMWKIGEDIPEGYWTMTPVGNQHAIYYYGDKVDDTGMNIDLWHSSSYWSDVISTRKNSDGSWKYTSDYHSFSLEMKNGFYIFVPCDTVFTPYAGKPGFGFK